MVKRLPPEITWVCHECGDNVHPDHAPGCPFVERVRALYANRKADY